MQSRASRSTIFETQKKTKLKGWIDTRIAWSPDGEEIVFVRNKGGFNDLYIYNLAEDKERRISARLRAKDPSFFPRMASASPSYTMRMEPTTSAS